MNNPASNLHGRGASGAYRSTALICGRCGQAHSAGLMTTVELRSGSHSTNEPERVSLCEGCADQFKAWLSTRPEWPFGVPVDQTPSGLLKRFDRVADG